ncbi:J domain-containing protein [Pseudomonas sp. NPDC089534]|uniref:J domain-containing protein n=1 Tax=Pseudomonas sp. NPDC089534 TaxID=3364468 RepID=UPI0038125F0A
MSCWTVLGLTADADVRTIKRQYAVLLKQTRPDDDPEGFQQLRDAYEQALHFKEWERSEAPPPEDASDWDLSGLTVVEADALQLAIRPVQGLSVTELERRHAVALEQGCAHILEDTVLQHCIEQPESCDALVDWAVRTFHWFGAWQRLELDEESIKLLLARQRERVARPLLEALEREDSEGFLQAFDRCAQFPWLTAEQNRPWFNLLLSQALLDTPHWLPAAFERVCAVQGWRTGPANPCPESEWRRLLARQDAPLFLAHQRQLALEPAATPAHRAARLLLGSGPFSQRRALARRLREADWEQCRKLSAELYANHRDVCAQMPGGTAFFWRDWEQAYDWTPYAAIVLACLIGTFAHFIPQGIRGGGLFNIFMTSSVCFAVITAGLHWVVHDFAHRHWLLDDRLSARLSPRFAAHAPLFGVLRDLAPGAVLVAGLCWLFGPIAGAVYATTLAAVGLVRRRQVKPRASWEQSGPALTVCLTIVGAAVLAVILGVLSVFASQGVVNRNQGLQPWAERLCSRLPASAEGCGAPATVEQWYPKEARP